MNAGDDRIFRERTEVLLGIRKPDDPNRAVRFKDLTSTTSKLFRTVSSGAINAAVAAIDKPGILLEVQNALTAKDVAIEAAQTSATSAINSANTVAGNLNLLVGNFLGDLPSLALADNNLGAEISGVRSDLTTAQASLNTSISGVRTDLTAAETEIDGVRSDLTTAQADIGLSFDDITGRVTAAENGITTEQTARTSADTSLTNSLSAAVSRIGASEAAIATEQATRADADTAITGTVSTLTTRVGTAEGAITAEQTARADADSAIVGTANALAARVGTAEGAITSEATARANDDSAIAGTVTALTSRVGTGEANLSQNYYTKSGSDSVLAAAKTELRSEISDADDNAIAMSDDNALERGPDTLTISGSGFVVLQPMDLAAGQREFVDSTDPEVGGKDLVATGYQTIRTRRRWAIARNRRYKLTYRLKLNAAAVSGQLYLGITAYSANGNIVPSNPNGGGFVNPNHYFSFGGPAGSIPADTWVEKSAEFNGSQIRSDAAFMRPLMYANYMGNTNQVTRLSLVRLEDITEVNTVAASIAQEATTRANADSAIVGTANALAARVTTAEGAITSEQTARADADSAIVTTANALTARVTTAEGKITTAEGRITSETTARVNADNAIISTANALTTRVGTAESAITAEQTARANADTAIVNTANALTARVGTAESAITSEATTRADADSAISASATALTTRVSTAEGAITSEANTRADADSAAAGTVNALTTRVSSAESAITTEQNTRADADSAVAGTVNALTTRVGDSEADITAEATTRSNADSAITSTVNALTTRVGDSEADITAEATTRSNADSAITSTVNTLTSRVSTAESAITSEQTTRADADTAAAGTVTALTTRMGSAESAITTNNTARVNADSAIVSSANALTTRVTNAESGITDEQTARASADSAIVTTANALSVRVGDSESEITAEQTARANADSAITATTNTLTNNVGTQTGRIDDIRALKSSAMTGTSLGTFLTQLQVNSGGTSALVSAQGSAISTLEGTVDALYTIEVKSGTSGALLQLIAPGGGASVAQLEANFINLKGKVSADSLLIGLGGNMIANSQFKQGLLGFKLETSGAAGLATALSIRPPLSSWAGKTYPTIMLSQSNAESVGYAEARNVQVETDRSIDNRAIPVAPGAYYELSAGISTHRCTGNLYIFWREADGAFISASSIALPSIPSSGGNPDLWPRYTVIAQAPANAAFAQMSARKNGTNSGTNSYLFLTKPMFAETHANATTSRPYTAGAATLIDGDGIVSDSVTADKMVAGTITAAEIKAATITAAEIAANTITANEIKAGTITATEIAANTITAGQIAANTIRASELAANSITAAGAHIANATVDTLQIKGNAVTVANFGIRTSQKAVYSSDGWVDICSVNLECEESFNVFCLVTASSAYSFTKDTQKLQYRVTHQGSSFGNFLETGETRVVYGETGPGGGDPDKTIKWAADNCIAFMKTSPGNGVKTFKLQARVGDGVRGVDSGLIRVQMVKR